MHIDGATSSWVNAALVAIKRGQRPNVVYRLHIWDLRDLEYTWVVYQLVTGVFTGEQNKLVKRKGSLNLDRAWPGWEGRWVGPQLPSVAGSRTFQTVYYLSAVV